MKQRVVLLRKLFNEFATLKDDQLIKLIKIYDTNLNQLHEINSKELFIIGNLIMTIGWFIFNACAVMFSNYEYGKGFGKAFDDVKDTPQYAVVTSILSASFSTLVTYLFYNWFPLEKGRTTDLCLTVVNASRAGVVMVTGVCDEVNLYAACIIGLQSGLLYLKVR